MIAYSSRDSGFGFKENNPSLIEERYAEYLMNKSLNAPKKPLAGSMKGTFVLPLAEDFDAPLEEFEEYM